MYDICLQVSVGTSTVTKLMTSLSSAESQMPQQLVLSTAGRHMLVALMLSPFLRGPAVLVWTMVSPTLFDSLFSLWVLWITDVGLILSMTEKYAQHWCSMLSDPEGVFAPCHSEISPDSYKEVRLTATAITCFCGSVSRPWDIIWRCTAFFLILPYRRTACMTAATVRTVRTACVLPSPPTCMPVQQQESRWAAGGRPFVVRNFFFIVDTFVNIHKGPNKALFWMVMWSLMWWKHPNITSLLSVLTYKLPVFGIAVYSVRLSHSDITLEQRSPTPLKIPDHIKRKWFAIHNINKKKHICNKQAGWTTDINSCIYQLKLQHFLSQ